VFSYFHPFIAVKADTTAQPIPFSQDWSDIALITVDDNWSNVPGIIGYRGDDLTTATEPIRKRF
jgi:hypothetical protein